MKMLGFYSEMTAFSFTFPLIMHFDPVVREDGNLNAETDIDGNWLN